MRDDFAAKDKQALGQRVGFLCSNPDCRALTIGPQQASEGAINLGVAAHVTAASPGGPRFDAVLTQDARRDLLNGVWLCQNCAKMVDSDPRFTPELLRAWKTVAEDRASTALGRSSTPASETREQALLRAIQPYVGKPITLAGMNSGRASLTSGPIRGVAPAEVVACNEFFVTLGFSDGTERSISLSNISLNFDDRNKRFQLQERYD